MGTISNAEKWTKGRTKKGRQNEEVGQHGLDDSRNQIRRQSPFRRWDFVFLPNHIERISLRRQSGGGVGVFPAPRVSLSGSIMGIAGKTDGRGTAGLGTAKSGSDRPPKSVPWIRFDEFRHLISMSFNKQLLPHVSPPASTTAGIGNLCVMCLYRNHIIRQ